MNALKGIITVAVILFCIGSMAFAQPRSMRGKSCFELQLGLWNEMRAGNQVGLGGATSEAKSRGFLGGISYSYWMREHLAISLAAGILAAEATSSQPFLWTPEQRSSSVVQILVGIKYHLLEPEPDESVRPYVAAAIGPVLGSESENAVFSQAAHSENAVGLRLGAGIDFLAGSWLKFGVNAGYNVMSDFRTPIGARKNYNGPDFSLGVGFLFGGRDPD
ncbi:MAG: hypothetical protein FJ217_03475 [Ignavibacteria bacterium]|nr:hypothetical protein [Ignavibacteria bacterium]